MIINIEWKYFSMIFPRNEPPTPCCENNLATILQRVSSSAMKFMHRWTMAINIHTIKASVLKFRDVAITSCFRDYPICTRILAIVRSFS